MSTLEAEDDALPDWSRTYAGYRERFVEPYQLTLGSGKVVLPLAQAPCVSAEHAREAKASADGSCTAGTVWDAGIVLAAHVFERYKSDEGSMRCLDLGAGTGVVGMAAAACGGFSRVVLTDLPSVVPLLERNAASSRGALDSRVDVIVKPLRWDDAAALGRMAALGPFDAIFGGDLLYRPQVVEPLLTALTALVSRQTTVVLAASLQHSPETLTLFAAAATTAGFRVERLGRDAQSAECMSPEVRLMRLTRRKAKPKKGPPAGTSDEKRAKHGLT